MAAQGTVTKSKKPVSWFIGSIVGVISRIVTAVVNMARKIIEAALSIVKTLVFQLFLVLLPFLAIAGVLWWLLGRQAEGETAILTAFDADKKEYTTHDRKTYKVTNPPEDFTADQLPAKVQFYYKSMAIQSGVQLINEQTPLTIRIREGFKVLEQNVTVPAPSDAADDDTPDVTSLLASAASL